MSWGGSCPNSLDPGAKVNGLVFLLVTDHQKKVIMLLLGRIPSLKHLSHFAYNDALMFFSLPCSKRIESARPYPPYRLLLRRLHRVLAIHRLCQKARCYQRMVRSWDKSLSIQRVSICWNSTSKNIKQKNTCWFKLVFMILPVPLNFCSAS